VIIIIAGAKRRLGNERVSDKVRAEAEKVKNPDR
jgi:hypothetical protein